MRQPLKYTSETTLPTAAINLDIDRDRGRRGVFTMAGDAVRQERRFAISRGPRIFEILRGVQAPSQSHCSSHSQ
jgi:hypothetical protein